MNFASLKDALNRLKTIRISRSPIAPQAAIAAFFAILGAAVAIAAWGADRSPAMAVALPLLWIMAPTRLAAFTLTTAYHLSVVRFLPEFASTWFNSNPIGVLIWLSMGGLCGLAWAVCWPRSSSTPRVTIATAAVLLLTLATPVAAVLPGHPLVGWGFLWPKSGWVGVATMFAASIAGAWALRVWIPAQWPGQRWISPVALFLALAIPAFVGIQPGGDAGKVAGKVGAVSTRFGGPPPTYSLEVMLRVEKIANATAKLAGGDDGLDTVIYPESIIGQYVPSLYPALEASIFRRSRPAGQTVILGADLELARGQWQNVALIFRPDGSSSYISSRQTPPGAMWTPWSSVRHYPANWFTDNTVNIGGGVRARIMFCYEEYMPILSLIDEAAYDHNMVVAISNLWATKDPLSSFVQGAHTQGMALLFGRRWVRAVNYPK